MMAQLQTHRRKKVRLESGHRVARPSLTSHLAKSATGAKKSGVASKSKYNNYMKKELARLKESEPDIPHKERYVLVEPQFVVDLIFFQIQEGGSELGRRG